MKTKRSLFYPLLSTMILAFVAMSPLAIDQIQKTSWEGIWEGKLEIGKTSLRIVFNIHHSDDSLSITLDSPDQGANGFAAQGIVLKNDSLMFNVPSIGGRFEGMIESGIGTMSGVWMQGPARLPLMLRRVEKVAALSRPQMPKKPYPYEEIEVSYKNSNDDITLAGTLTKPKGAGPFPAVILITGSGAQDRDETLLGHKPFLVIADYLTRRGIAVLRVDDRGVGGSSGVNRNSTTADFANDVLAGVKFLSNRTDINPRKIGLIGHSEGGVVAPLAASKTSDIAFIVMMAGTGITGEEIIYLQSALISRANGEPEEEVRRGNELNRSAIAIAKMDLDSAAERNEVRKAVGQFVNALTDSQRATMKDPIGEIEAQTRMFYSPWAKFFLTYDPRAALRKVRCPVLVMNGEKDLQVPPAENLKEIEKALKEGRNSRYTIALLPGLNHLFQRSATGSPQEYGTIEETIAPEALKVMGDWIAERTK